MRVEYVLGEAATNLRRNALLVAGAVMAVFVSLALVFLGLIVRGSVEVTTDRWQDGISVIAWLRDDLSIGEHTALQEEVQGWEEVENAIYHSKADAWEEFKVLFSDNQDLIEEMDPALLPASLRLELTDQALHQQVVNRLTRVSGVRDIQVPTESIERQLNLSEGLNLTTVVLGVVLGAAAIIMISNTVLMAIHARREEIGIMKLVGASNWYVRTPFLVEGVIEGVLGAVLAVAVIWISHETILTNLDSASFLNTSGLPDGFLVSRSLLIVAFGALAGLMGSIIGVVRYLRT